MKKVKKMKFKLVIAMALAVTLVASAISLSVFAGGPYTKETLPGYNEYEAADFDENDELMYDEDGNVITHFQREIVFQYSHYSPYDREELYEDMGYWFWESAEEDLPAGYLNNGYTIQVSDLLDWAQAGEYWTDEDDNLIILRGWSLSEGGAAITEVTEENFGCTLYPIVSPATEEEKAAIEEEERENIRTLKS